MDRTSSSVHKYNMNSISQSLHPNGTVPFDEARPPSGRIPGVLRACAYCGSMHPSDVATAIEVGATGHLADMKYGWPHKVYFDNVPNPHTGMPESHSVANYQVSADWVKINDDDWSPPPQPAPNVVMGKFYTIHLQDATPDERALIERHIGIQFTFIDGQVSWQMYRE